MNSKKLKTIAKISIGTKRKKRELNLLEVAEEMKSLYDSCHSLEKVGKLVRLSQEMVREFLKINDLDESVKGLIRNGLIKGVDIGYRISKIGNEDQAALASCIVKKNLTSNDVRSIVRYKIDNPDLPIERAVNKIIKSKDRQVYVAYLGIGKDVFEEFSEKYKEKDLGAAVRHIFTRLVPPKQIVYLELNGRVVILKVGKEGLQAIREQAKLLKIPLAKLADALVRDWIKEGK